MQFTIIGADLLLLYPSLLVGNLFGTDHDNFRLQSVDETEDQMGARIYRRSQMH